MTANELRTRIDHKGLLILEALLPYDTMSFTDLMASTEMTSTSAMTSRLKVLRETGLIYKHEQGYSLRDNVASWVHDLVALWGRAAELSENAA